MISRNEMVAIINTTYDAVNQSKAGPIFKENSAGELELKSLGYNTFLYAVQKVLPMIAEMRGEFIADDGETKVRHATKME